VAVIPFRDRWPFPLARIWAGVLLMFAFSASALIAQDRWRVSEVPTLELGMIDGPDHLVFHDVRGAIVVGTHSVVADGASSEVRVFDLSGAYLRSFGRPGDGPKEFRRIGWLDVCGGTDIVAWDSRRNRITKWDISGNLRDEFSISSPDSEMPPYGVACGPNGDFIVMAWPRAVTAERTQGPYRPPVAIGLAGPEGQLHTELGRFPGSERLRTEHNDRPHPFGRETSIALGPGGAYIGTADSTSITWIRPDGERLELPRFTHAADLTEELRERWVDHYLARAPEDQRSSLKRSLMSSPWVPDVTPHYSGFRVDRLGHLWVAPFVLGEPSADVPANWVVFGADGRLVAEVSIPSNVQPTDIGTDYLVGVAVDAMGVERVGYYRVVR